MKEATITLFNFDGRKKDIFEEAKEQTKIIESAGFEIDELIIKFADSARFQSDPDEGNLPAKETK